MKSLSIVKTALLMLLLQGCAHNADIFRDPNMDFGSVKTVAVMPFVNLSKDSQAADRVRDVLTTSLLSSGAIYVVPSGEVARGTINAGVANATTPTADEVTKLSKMMKIDAVITGVVREYGDVRSGAASADVVSLGLQMMEGQTGKVIWAAATTKGGISVGDRLFGGGGRPLNDVTEAAVNDILNKLFQ